MNRYESMNYFLEPPRLDTSTLAWEAALEANEVYDDLQTIDSRLGRVGILASSELDLPETAFSDMRAQLLGDRKTSREEFDRLTDIAAIVMNMPDSPFKVVAASAEPLRYNLSEGDSRVFKSPEVTKDLLDREADSIAYTIRDALVLGKDYVKKHTDSSLRVRAVERSIAEVNPQLNWEKAPSVADIVQVCSTLDQVTAKGLGEFGWGIRMSVHDVLVTSPKELATAMDQFHSFAPIDVTKALELKHKALEFAVEFYKEREKLN